MEALKLLHSCLYAGFAVVLLDLRRSHHNFPDRRRSSAPIKLKSRFFKISNKPFPRGVGESGLLRAHVLVKEMDTREHILAGKHAIAVEVVDLYNRISRDDVPLVRYNFVQCKVQLTSTILWGLSVKLRGRGK
ncbi:hypothetical protein DFS34DRAFT_677288, partial [Phlyctochytrium arcticum]